MPGNCFDLSTSAGTIGYDLSTSAVSMDVFGWLFLLVSWGKS